MTALARRVRQVAEGLTPTEAVVRWLLEAQSHGSLAACATWQRETCAPHPYELISRQVRLDVKQAHPELAKRDLTEQGDRAVKAGLLRIYRVEILQQWLSDAQGTEQMVLATLEDLGRLVQRGGVEPTIVARWVGQVEQVVTATTAWQVGIELVAQRYFADHSTVFPDVAAQVAQTREQALALSEQFLVPPDGYAHGRVGDVAAWQRAGQGHAEDIVERLVQQVRLQWDLLQHARAGHFWFGREEE